VMAAAITALLEDEPLRLRLGAEARRRGAAHDIERSVDRIAELLAELAGARATAAGGGP